MRLILSTAILLFGAGYLILTEWYPDVTWLHTVTAKQAWPALVCSLSLFFIITQSLRKKGDPVLAAWMAFGLSGSLLLVPLLIAKDAQFRIDSDRRMVVSELRQEARARLRAIEQEKLDALKKQIPEGTTDRFARYSGRVDAMSLGKIRVLDAQMQKDVEARAQAYQDALEANPTKGPNSWVTFRTLEDLDAELQAHRTLYAATRTFTQFIESFEETYTKAIEELELKPPADRIAIAEMERVLQTWEANNTYEIRKLDVVILAAAVNGLQILHDDWGRWSYSPRDEQITFEDPDSERSFIEAIQRLSAAAKEVADLTNPNKSE